MSLSVYLPTPMCRPTSRERRTKFSLWPFLWTQTKRKPIWRAISTTLVHTHTTQSGSAGSRGCVRENCTQWTCPLCHCPPTLLCKVFWSYVLYSMSCDVARTVMHVLRPDSQPLTHFKTLAGLLKKRPAPLQNGAHTLHASQRIAQ